MKRFILIIGLFCLLVSSVAAQMGGQAFTIPNYSIKPIKLNDSDLLDARRFQTLAAGVTAAAGKTLIITTAWTLTGNLTIPQGTALVINRGGSIAKASTYTLTINGSLQAGPYQVFSGFSTGNVTFGSGSVEKILPEWFGAVSGSGTNDYTKLQSCIDAGAAAAIPCFIDGTFYSGSSLALEGSDNATTKISKLIGVTYHQSKIIFTGTSSGIVSANTGTRKFHAEVRDLSIVNNNASNTGHGVDLSAMSYVRVERVWSEGWKGYGFRLVMPSGQLGTANNYFNKNMAYMTGGGYYFDGASGSAIADSLIEGCTAAYGVDNTKYALYLGEFAYRNKVTGFSYKYGASDLLAKAIYIEGTGNIILGSSGEVNQVVPEIEVSAKGVTNTISGSYAQSADRIYDYGSMTSWFSNQMPISSRYDHNFDILTFEIVNPGAGSPESSLKLIGSAGTVKKYQPWAGSVIGAVLHRDGGTAPTGGYLRVYPKKTGVTFSGSFYQSISSVNDPRDTMLASKGTYTFAAGDFLEATYLTSGGWDGTGYYTLDLWITRDGVKH